MIQMHHVYLRYDANHYGLRDVSLDLARGEFAFPTGPSGAGKTTLLRLLFGGLKPTAGQILIAGRNLTRLPESAIPEVRRQIGVWAASVAVRGRVAGGSRRVATVPTGPPTSKPIRTMDRPAGARP